MCIRRFPMRHAIRSRSIHSIIENARLFTRSILSGHPVRHPFHSTYNETRDKEYFSYLEQNVRMIISVVVPSTANHLCCQFCGLSSSILSANRWRCQRHLNLRMKSNEHLVRWAQTKCTLHNHNRMRTWSEWPEDDANRVACRRLCLRMEFQCAQRQGTTTLNSI